MSDNSLLSWFRHKSAGSILSLALSVLVLFILAPAFAKAEDGEWPAVSVLKICADPFLLPFSNRQKQGYENKIAELLAKELNSSLHYEFFPQRMGFIRNTLRAELDDGSYKCDLVISAPAYFDLAATTQPYYRSVYMLVYAKGRGLDAVTKPDMLGKLSRQGKKIRFGLFDRGPGQLWVFKHNLMDNMVPYVSQPGAADANPGMDILQDIIDDKIDVAIVWGPVAGYFYKNNKSDVELVMLPLEDDPDNPEMRFKYSVSMAIRYGERKWKEQLSQLIKKNQDKINEILINYGIPLIPMKNSGSVNIDDD